MWQLMRTILVILLVTVPVSMVLAQHHYHGEGDLPRYDPAVAPLIIPSMDDFLPPPAEEPESVDMESAPLSLGAHIDVAGEMKMFTFAPWYTFSEAFSAKIRVPWIFQRTLNYWGGPAKASGLGDISIDGQYTHRFAAPNRVLRLLASVKLPTGNDEKLDANDRLVPLGTGTVDLSARVQYAQSTDRTGLLVTGLYRRNSEGERIEEYPGGFTTTYNTTNGHQLVGAVFARQRMNDRLWLHLGTGVMLTGNGSIKEVYRDAGGNVTGEDSGDILQKSTLIDLFPGVSYKLGRISPYLGIRVPLVTSYEDETIDESRDMAVILQVSYRPDRLF